MDGEASVDDHAQGLLKLAYIKLGDGEHEAAMEACRQAEKRPGAAPLARALQGAVLSARGDTKEAMSYLMKWHRRHPDAIGIRIYLAEACWLEGRKRRAHRLLDESEGLEEEGWGQMADSLRETWGMLEDLENSPAQ